MDYRWVILIYGARKSKGNYSACLIFYSSSLNSVAVVVVYKKEMKESTIPPFANNIMCLTTYFKPQLTTNLKFILVIIFLFMLTIILCHMTGEESGGNSFPVVWLVSKVTYYSLITSHHCLQHHDFSL